MELYVFGSLTSGEIDAGSDADVLVLVDGNETAKSYPSGWSVYSKERIASLYQRGTLFAWHLYQDAAQIWPRDGVGFLSNLGQPSHYSEYSEEIAALSAIARRAAEEIGGGTPSVTFELGLLGLATRDVAMAAAPVLLGRMNFSRYLPLQYCEPQFPLQHAEYEYLLRCRRASTRGNPINPNDETRRDTIAKLERLLAWLHEIEWRVANA